MTVKLNNPIALTPLRISIAWSILALAGSLDCLAASTHCEVTYRKEAFRYRGKEVEVQVYEPKAKGRFPLVLMVHGSGGVFLTGGEIPLRENFGERTIAENCFVTALPHYFDLQGVAKQLDVDVMQIESPEWLDLLQKAITWAIRSHKSVDGRRVAVVGESLGGFLAAALGATDKRIRAVAVLSGGYRKPIGKKERRRFPPLDIQHGTSDDVVPIDEARKLLAAYRLHGSVSELTLIGEAGHYLSHGQWKSVILHWTVFLNHTLGIKT